MSMILLFEQITLAKKVVPTPDDVQQQYVYPLLSWDSSPLPKSPKLSGSAAQSPIEALKAGRINLLTLPEYRSKGFQRGQILEVKTSNKVSHFVRITGVIPSTKLTPAKWAAMSGLDYSDAEKVKAAFEEVSCKKVIFFRPLRDSNNKVITSRKDLKIAEPAYVGNVTNIKVQRHKGKAYGAEYNGFPGVVKHNVDNSKAVVILKESSMDSMDNAMELARDRARSKKIPVFEISLDSFTDQQRDEVVAAARGKAVNVVGPSSFLKDFAKEEQSAADAAVGKFWFDGNGPGLRGLAGSTKILAIGQEGIEEAFLRNHLASGGCVDIHTVDWTEKDCDLKYRLAGVPEAVAEAKQARREFARAEDVMELTTALIQAEIRKWAKENADTSQTCRSTRKVLAL